MNIEVLFAHFNRISDAPDAIPRLRRFILDLAVRGKIVEQRPTDASAAELLKRIDEGSRLAPKKRRSTKDEVDCKPKPPFEVPTGWLWVRFGRIHDLMRGVTYSKSDASDVRMKGYLPILRANNIGISLNFDDLVFVKKTNINEEQLLRRGDYLIALSSGSKNLVGKAAFVKEDYEGAFGGFCGVVRLYLPCLEPFVGIYLASRLYRDAIAAGSRGIGINNLKKETLSDLPFPLPPLAEQNRIVAKMDELMDLCDRLEAVRTEREARRISLAAASYHHLNNGSNTETLRQYAKFYLTHLSQLVFQSDQIKLLRQTILNLAVRGQLVPQDFNDAPVSELLGRIQAEKAGLIGARAQELEYRESRLSNEEIPFDLPSSWQWEPLLSFIVFGPQNGISPKPSSRPDAPKAVTLTATTKGTFDSRHFKQVDATFPQDSEFWLRPGDFLFQRGNTREYVGMAAYYSGEPGLFLYPDLMIKVRLSEKVSLRYVHLCAVAPYARNYFSTHATGAQATMPKINQGVLVKLPIPLAPLAEQQRIVAKVDELMVLCDQLESRLTSAQTESSRLLEAVLHHALCDAPTSSSGTDLPNVSTIFTRQ
jgi:type I restriction enzyme S subunit